LTEKYSRKKIRNGSDAGDADAFTAQFLDPLNMWLGHRKDKHAIYGYGDIDRIRPCEFGVHTSWAANRCHVYTSAHERLNRSRSCGDVDELDVQAVALEYPCFFCDPGDRERGGDRRVSDTESLEPLGGMTPNCPEQNKKTSDDRDHFAHRRRKGFHAFFSPRI